MSDYESEDAIEWLKQVVQALRNIRGEADIKPGTRINILLQGGSERDKKLAATTQVLLSRLAKVDAINWLEDQDEPPANALALVDTLKVMVPLTGLIDVVLEKTRLSKEIERKQKDLERIDKKLSNENFISKAPSHVVAKEKARASDLKNTITILQTQIEALDRV